MNLASLQRWMRQLDGRIVHVRVFYRSGIERAEDEYLKTRLGDGTAEIPAVFPTEGRRAVQSLPLQRFHAAGRRISPSTFFCRVDADLERLVVVGRTHRVLGDNRGVEYAW